MLAQNERARPIAQVYPDRVGGEMKEGRKQARRHSRLGPRFQLARKALTFFVMIVPAVIEQHFQRANFITSDHSGFLRQAPEFKARGYLADAHPRGQSAGSGSRRAVLACGLQRTSRSPLPW